MARRSCFTAGLWPAVLLLLVLVLHGHGGPMRCKAATPGLLLQLLQQARTPDMQQYMRACRHHLHTYPELRFEEHNTSTYLQQQLADMGIGFRAPYAGTGIAAVIGKEGEEEAGQGRVPSIALRADMDALPVTQAQGLPPPHSAVQGAMHACGHDAHMCMLLGAARLLKARESALSGRVVLLFQPAEEGGGGARFMVDQGALRGAQAAAGIHVWPSLPAGTVGVRPGVMMAASDRFQLTVSGRGGHAALPHLARDPVVAASAVVLALQALVSRETSPLDSAVVTVTRFDAGSGAANVIPDAVTLHGTIRALKQELFDWLRGRVEQVAGATALAHGCNLTQTTWSEVPYPPTVNDPGMTSLVRELVEEAEEGSADEQQQQDEVGDVRFELLEHPSMAAEDFSFYCARVPSVFAFLGIGDEQRGTHMPLHHPAFRMNDEQLALGAALHASVAVEYLERQSRAAAHDEL